MTVRTGFSSRQAQMSMVTIGCLFPTSLVYKELVSSPAVILTSLKSRTIGGQAEQDDLHNPASAV
jgi:hypothetical protein